MAKSESQAQAELLTEGWIDRLAVEKVDRTGGSGTPTIEELLARYAGEFVIAVRENLDRVYAVDLDQLHFHCASSSVVKDSLTTKTGHQFFPA